jgi:hypothetical protein
MLNPNQTPETGGGVLEFIQKHRKTIYICVGVVV